MKNLENTKTIETLRVELFSALQSEDTTVQEKAFTAFAEGMQDEITAKAEERMKMFSNAHSDEQILVHRGTRRALTSEEKKYFNAVVERGGFDKVEKTFPTTIIEDVFKNLKTEHPLLSRIDMRNTNAMLRYIFANPNKATAYWGPICEDIKQMILEGFTEIKLDSSRLSGFVAVCKGMLELGPVWLADYIIELMYEIMATALETAVVAGTGKDQPIGMIKQLSGATDSVYPDKDKITMADFEPATLAGVRAALAKAKLDSKGVVIMVNPVTYWAKVFPNLAFRNANGEWIHDRLPTGEEILQSYAVPEDTLVFGNPKNYFLGVSGAVRIDKYEETLAIEDMTLYIAKFYGYGLAKDANAFFVADIATVDGATVPDLEVYEETPEETPGA